MVKRRGHNSLWVFSLEKDKTLLFLKKKKQKDFYAFAAKTYVFTSSQGPCM
jgi:hypothetical protein